MIPSVSDSFQAEHGPLESRLKDLTSQSVCPVNEKFDYLMRCQPIFWVKGNADHEDQTFCRVFSLWENGKGSAVAYFHVLMEASV